MARFRGKQYTGASRDLKTERRTDADVRNQLTVPWKRKAHARTTWAAFADTKEGKGVSFASWRRHVNAVLEERDIESPINVGGVAWNTHVKNRANYGY